MYAEIIIDITNEALDRAYTYHIPEGMDLHVGDRVTIPFGASNAEKTGYVVGLRETFDYDPSKVKDIVAVIPDAISVQEQLIHLAAWMSTEYGTTMNQCLKTVLPVRRTVRKNARRVDPIRMYQNEQDEYHDLNPAQAQAAAAVIAGYQACVAKRTHRSAPGRLHWPKRRQRAKQLRRMDILCRAICCTGSRALERPRSTSTSWRR